MILSEVKHKGWVYGVNLSTDNQLLASASDDLTARLTRITDGVTLCEVKHEMEVVGVQISTDNQLLATACHDTARMFDIGILFKKFY